MLKQISLVSDRYRKMSESSAFTSQSDLVLASRKDFIVAQEQLARARCFNLMNDAEKLYFLMVCVRQPVSFDILCSAARFNGISSEELAVLLIENPKYFFEIDEKIWMTRMHAESEGLIPCSETHRPNKSVSENQNLPSADLYFVRNIRPVKNGICCLSPEEIVELANRFVQTKEFKSHQMTNQEMLFTFLSRMPRPIRSSDLNDAVFGILKFSISPSTLRKYLSTNRRDFCSPSHGVWCTQMLAQELGLEEHRTPITTSEQHHWE